MQGLRWRQNLISTYLERDIPTYGTRIPTQTLRRFWTMLAHNQGDLLNLSQLSKNLMVDTKTVNRYLDLLGHALLGIPDIDGLLGHPVVGTSWEGFAIETLLNAAPFKTESGFYRSSNGTEIDLLLNVPNQGSWAIEIKRAACAKPRRGFYAVCDDLQPTKRLLETPCDERYPIGEA